MRAIMETLAAAGWDKPTLAAAINGDREAATCARRLLEQFRHPLFKPAELIERFDQFAQEHQQIIPKAVDAMVTKDWKSLGLLVEQSQTLAETALHNQVPETIALVRQARELHASATSAFGAGFGGSVWAMVCRSEAVEFAAAWQRGYLERFPQHASQAQFFVTAPVGSGTPVGSRSAEGFAQLVDLGFAHRRDAAEGVGAEQRLRGEFGDLKAIEGLEDC